MERLIKKILKAIEKQGIKAYLVGGYVRDSLIGIKSYDIDIAINQSSKNLLKLFKDASYNETYDSLKFQRGYYHFDITPLRCEEYENNNLKITYNCSLEQDALRRDFTINALYMDSQGNIIDPLNGLNDLNKSKIKVIGDPIIRLTEDPLRIIRALRFSFKLNFTLENNLLDFLKNNKHLITQISYFRKKEELNKIFSLPNKIENLTFLKENDFLKYLEIDYEKINYTTNYIGIWAQLTYSSNYPFTVIEKNSLEKLKQYKEINNITLYYLGPNLSFTLNEILNAHKNINEMYKKLPLKSSNELKIKYQDLHNLEYKDKEISGIIKYIEEQVLLNNVPNKKQAIIKFLKNNRR